MTPKEILDWLDLWANLHERHGEDQAAAALREVAAHIRNELAIRAAYYINALERPLANPEGQTK
jgi:hypothetical protein